MAIQKTTNDRNPYALRLSDPFALSFLPDGTIDAAAMASLTLGGCKHGVSLGLLEGRIVFQSSGNGVIDLGETRPICYADLEQALRERLPGVRLRGCGHEPQLLPCVDCRCPEAPGEERLLDGRMKRWNLCETMVCPRCGECDGVGLGYYRDGSNQCGWLCPRCGDFPFSLSDLGLPCEDSHLSRAMSGLVDMPFRRDMPLIDASAVCLADMRWRDAGGDGDAPDALINAVWNVMSGWERAMCRDEYVCPRFGDDNDSE
jgi:hypothetical protein